MALDLCDDFGISEEWKPVLEEVRDMFFELVLGHATEIRVEDPFHAACSEDFIEWEKSEEDEGEEAAGGLLPQDVAAEDELGVPGDDGLVEVEEDVVRGGLHCG